MYDLIRGGIGIISLVGFGTATVIMIIAEGQKIANAEKSLISRFQRFRRILTSCLLVVLLLLGGYGWISLDRHASPTHIHRYLFVTGTLLSGIIVLAVWDLVDSFRHLKNSLGRQIEQDLESIKDDIHGAN